MGRSDNEELSNITKLVDTLKAESGPRDLQQLKDLRQAIKLSANPNDPNAYRLMKIIQKDFDDYLDNLPKQSILAGDAKEGMQAWSEARKLFNQEKKAETFQNILKNLDIEKNKYSQSGAENYLANELRKIAKDDDTMRLFSKYEQAEITKAAQGGSLQNMLRYIGKFAPTGVIPGLGAFGLWNIEPSLGVGVPAAGLASRKAAEQIRVGDVQRLMDLMRTGIRPPSPFEGVPATFSRGLLSTELE